MTNEDLIRMRRAGWLIREIAEISGIPFGTLRSRFQRWGVKPDEPPLVFPRRPIKHDFPRWLIHEMYWVCGLPTTAIAYELDISTGAVISIMSRHDIPRRSRSESMKLYLERHPEKRTPACATREQALRAAAVSARNRRRRAERNRRRRERRSATQAAA